MFKGCRVAKGPALTGCAGGQHSGENIAVMSCVNHCVFMGVLMHYTCGSSAWSSVCFMFLLPPFALQLAQSSQNEKMTRQQPPNPGRGRLPDRKTQPIPSHPVIPFFPFSSHSLTAFQPKCPFHLALGCLLLRTNRTWNIKNM